MCKGRQLWYITDVPERTFQENENIDIKGHFLVIVTEHFLAIQWLTSKKSHGWLRGQFSVEQGLC